MPWVQTGHLETNALTLTVASAGPNWVLRQHDRLLGWREGEPHEAWTLPLGDQGASPELLSLPGCMAAVVSRPERGASALVVFDPESGAELRRHTLTFRPAHGFAVVYGDIALLGEWQPDSSTRLHRFHVSGAVDTPRVVQGVRLVQALATAEGRVFAASLDGLYVLAHDGSQARCLQAGACRYVATRGQFVYAQFVTSSTAPTAEIGWWDARSPQNRIGAASHPTDHKDPLMVPAPQPERVLVRRGADDGVVVLDLARGRPAWAAQPGRTFSGGAWTDQGFLGLFAAGATPASVLVLGAADGKAVRTPELNGLVGQLHLVGDRLLVSDRREILSFRWQR